MDGPQRVWLAVLFNSVLRPTVDEADRAEHHTDNRYSQVNSDHNAPPYKIDRNPPARGFISCYIYNAGTGKRFQKTSTICST